VCVCVYPRDGLCSTVVVKLDHTNDYREE